MISLEDIGINSNTQEEIFTWDSDFSDPKFNYAIADINVFRMFVAAFEERVKIAANIRDIAQYPGNPMIFAWEKYTNIQTKIGNYCNSIAQIGLFSFQYPTHYSTADGSIYHYIPTMPDPIDQDLVGPFFIVQEKFLYYLLRMSDYSDPTFAVLSNANHQTNKNFGWGELQKLVHELSGFFIKSISNVESENAPNQVQHFFSNKKCMVNWQSVNEPLDTNHKIYHSEYFDTSINNNSDAYRDYGKSGDYFPYCFRRKYPRMIYSLKFPGELGQIAYFQWRGTFIYDDNGPDTLVNLKGYSVNNSFRFVTGKVVIYTETGWQISDDQSLNPDLIEERGLFQYGDYLGPWILNDLRDAINKLQWLYFSNLPIFNVTPGYLNNDSTKYESGYFVGGLLPYTFDNFGNKIYVITLGGNNVDEFWGQNWQLNQEQFENARPYHEFNYNTAVLPRSPEQLLYGPLPKPSGAIRLQYNQDSQLTDILSIGTHPNHHLSYELDLYHLFRTAQITSYSAPQNEFSFAQARAYFLGFYGSAIPPHCTFDYVTTEIFTDTHLQKETKTDPIYDFTAPPAPNYGDPVYWGTIGVARPSFKYKKGYSGR